MRPGAAGAVLEGPSEKADEQEESADSPYDRSVPQLAATGVSGAPHRKVKPRRDSHNLPKARGIRWAASRALRNPVQSRRPVGLMIPISAGW